MRNTWACSSFKFLSSALALGFLLFLALFPSPFLPAALDDIPFFAPVTDWLYRGGQPKEGAFEKLKEKGIRTVVNFRDDKKWIEWEKQKVEALGMKYVSLPWNITRSVKPQLLDQFFKVLDNPQNRPVFFHCEYGRDRSGVMTMMALMRYEKLSKEEARELALETIRPHLRYQFFVNRKINFFLKERKEALSPKAFGG